MEREVLHTAETNDFLVAKFVAVKVDAGDATNEEGMRLVQRFDVHALPCDIIVDPLSGRVLSVKTGFQDQRSYLSVAMESCGRFEKSLKTQLASQPKATNNAAPEASGTGDLGDAQPFVGLDGFSPIALAKRKDWIRGQREFAWEHKGITYYLATREELDEFRKSPEDYAPKLLGCDAVVLWESDRAVAGDTRYGAFFDGELYLFQSADTRKKFKSNPTRYTRIQHVLRVDSIERTVVR
jgi:YHS domain-containing protein